METGYLRTLQRVLELGSFSKAARELCITQSAVSQRIKLLEERYGHSLVERDGTVARATQAGALVRAKAEKILSLEREMESELQEIGRKKRISLCSTPTFGIVYLPQLLNRFLLTHSGDMDLKFMLNTPEMSLKGLLQNEFDLAVIEHHGALPAEELAVRSLPPDRLVLISAPGLSLSAPLMPLDELLHQRLIARREGCSSRCLLQANLQQYGKSIENFRSTIIYDDLHLTIQTVLAGRGIAFVSRSLVNEQLRRGELREHEVEGFVFFRSRSMLVQPNRQADPVLQEFCNAIVDLFGPAPHECHTPGGPPQGREKKIDKS